MQSEFDVIRRCTKSAPVDIVGLAESLGLRVLGIRLPENVSGKLLRTPAGYEIHFNRDHGSNRIRFTVAHETAHYILHRDKIESEVVDDEWYRSTLFAGTKFETQANSYAAELLMPRELVVARYERHASNGLDDRQITETMAREFEVSKDAMAIRLKVVVQLPLAV
jgi:Zn-dependent peptidase ImmA (M78 family)